MERKMQKQYETIVDKLPQCDFCKPNLLVPWQAAYFDGRTRMGPWAFLCREHFRQFGVGLGTGKGQKLVLRRK